MTPEYFAKRLAREKQARKEAEQLLERKSAQLYEANQQLLRINAQLEAQAKDLAIARDAALELTKTRSMFLANMSHEIRTPLNGVVGMTELVLESKLSAEQREYLSMAKTSANSLLSLINAILDLSKIEAGSLEIEAIPFSLQDLVNETVYPFRLHAAQKGLAFSSEMAANVPRRVVGDPGRIRQVITNLVGNAIKFTSSGEVSLRVRDGEVTACGEVPLQFAVRDTGIGIPRDKQNTIFNAFTQVDGSITRRFGGTGLGLSIAAKLVEMMSGRIWVESEPGQGSTFHFTVLVKVDDMAIEQQVATAMAAPRWEVGIGSAGHQPLRLLVAEDNPVNTRLMSALLLRQGHAVQMVSNGRDAVQAFQPGRFDAILMDVSMPEMDGFEATAAIRRIERELGQRRTPIVALTAHAMKGDMERCIEAGMDDYLSKPIRSADLFEKLSRLITVPVS